MLLWYFLTLLTVHWVADFILQTRWQAENKSFNNEALVRHVFNYTLCLLFACFVLWPKLFWLSMGFAALNGVLHFATDFVTSRASSHFYKKEDYYSFFVVIGLDQLIHQVTLAVTLYWFFG